jgi:hypothetical protein
VQYTLGGSAQNGSDVQPLSGVATFAAGSMTTSISIEAIADAIAEGSENLALTVQPGDGYAVGDVGSASVTVLDRPIDAWRHANFNSAELADPEISGDMADPDGDEASNLEEYALARNPRAGEASGLVKAIEQGLLTLTYHRRKSATDTQVVPEGSLDLKNWATAGLVEEVARVDQGTSQAITVRLVPPSPSERGFLRVRVIPMP